MTLLTNILNRFSRLKRKAGLIGACRYVLKTAFQGANSADVGILQRFPTIDLPPFGPPLDLSTIPQRHINWIIPDFSAGSGGHMTIFRLMHHLEQLGFIHHIYLARPCGFPNTEKARTYICKHFFPLDADVTIGHEHMRPAWASVATRWDTAYILRAFRSTLRKYYLVQDFEPSFYPLGSTAVFAENTYRFGFYGLTAGTWLSSLLTSRYKMDATPFSFAVDHDIYNTKHRKAEPTGRILFYARPVTERRGFELGLLALKRLVAQMNNVEVVLVGWDEVDVRPKERFKKVGVVPPEHLAYWLNRCDAALVLSFTNLSLLPLEAMACGSVAVSNRGDNVAWLLNKQNAVLADADTVSLCEALKKVISDHELRNRIARSALKWVRSKNWDKAYQSVVEVMQQHHEEDTASRMEG